MIIGATAHVTSIITTVPLSTVVSSMRDPSGITILYPIVTTASATAVCAVVRPNITWRSTDCILNHRCATKAASHLLANATMSIFTAIIMVSVWVITLTSTIIPTPIRK